MRYPGKEEILLLFQEVLSYSFFRWWQQHSLCPADKEKTQQGSDMVTAATTKKNPPPSDKHQLDGEEEITFGHHS